MCDISGHEFDGRFLWTIWRPLPLIRSKIFSKSAVCLEFLGIQRDCSFSKTSD